VKLPSILHQLRTHERERDVHVAQGDSGRLERNDCGCNKSAEGNKRHDAKVFANVQPAGELGIQSAPINCAHRYTRQDRYG